jgi:hypothetical protein
MTNPDRPFPTAIVEPELVRRLLVRTAAGEITVLFPAQLAIDADAAWSALVRALATAVPIQVTKGR